MEKAQTDGERAWDRLCDLTSDLVVSGFKDGRPAAFTQVCRQHPDLAATATYPGTDKLISGARTVAPKPARVSEESPLMRAVNRRVGEITSRIAEVTGKRSTSCKL